MPTPSPKAVSAPYPATLDLAHALVVVLGAGKVAAQKLKGLPEGVAQVRVVGPKAHADVLAWLKKHPQAAHLARPFEPGDLRGCRLLFCCTPDADVNAFAARQAKAIGAWVCQASEPDQGDLRVPAVISAAGLQMTLSTGGASPALAKALRAHFEKTLKASDLGFVLAEMKKLRPLLKKDPALKTALLKRLGTPQALALMLDKRSKAGRAKLQKALRPGR
jgi:precorrin-2 dehydrogenase/sirohydrochlorin ferrochelatase